MNILHFHERNGGFNYVFEYELSADEQIIVMMPRISPNKRGVNDMAWQTDGDVTLLGTLSPNPEKENTMWQEIGEEYDINKCTYALKIINNGNPCRIIIRALLN